MSNQAIEKAEKSMEFTPFGGEQKIKLSISIVKNVCAVKTKSGRTCSDADALKFMMLCQGKGLNPFEGDAYLVGYDNQKTGVPSFSQITAIQALLKRAEVHAEYDGMQSGVIVKTDNEQIQERETCFVMEGEEILGGWAKVYRKDNQRPSYSKLAISQRKPPYETQFWQGSKAAEQIQKCAEADALRMAFPTKIGGLFLRDEMDFPINIDAKAIEMPTHRLVDITPAELPPPQEENGAVEAEKKVEPAPASSARADLAQFVISEGYNFDHFRKWAIGSANVPDADSLGSFDEVPEADAKRLLRSKEGLKKGLRLAKGDE